MYKKLLSWVVISVMLGTVSLSSVAFAQETDSTDNASTEDTTTSEDGTNTSTEDTSTAEDSTTSEDTTTEDTSTEDTDTSTDDTTTIDESAEEEITPDDEIEATPDTEETSPDITKPRFIQREKPTLKMIKERIEGKALLQKALDNVAKQFAKFKAKKKELKELILKKKDLQAKGIGGRRHEFGLTHGRAHLRAYFAKSQIEQLIKKLQAGKKLSAAEKIKAAKKMRAAARMKAAQTALSDDQVAEELKDWEAVRELYIEINTMYSRYLENIVKPRIVSQISTGKLTQEYIDNLLGAGVLNINDLTNPIDYELEIMGLFNSLLEQITDEFVGGDEELAEDLMAAVGTAQVLYHYAVSSLVNVGSTGVALSIANLTLVEELEDGVVELEEQIKNVAGLMGVDAEEYLANFNDEIQIILDDLETVRQKTDEAAYIFLTNLDIIIDTGGSLETLMSLIENVIATSSIDKTIAETFITELLNIAEGLKTATDRVTSEDHRANEQVRAIKEAYKDGAQTLGKIYAQIAVDYADFLLKK